MKNKYFMVILFLTLAVFLNGCNGVITPATDEAKIKSVINGYVLALNNQDWSKAKSYCVYGGLTYNELCEMEANFNNAYLYCDVITIQFVIDIQNVSIDGNYATVSIYFNLLMTDCGNEYYAEEGEGEVWLQKVGNSWKIY
jgi:hypothetical protein